MKPMKKIALLHSMCSVGKASITNMLPILSIMGVEACPIPTVLFSTHTSGYGMPAMQNVSAEYIRECGEHFYKNNISFDMIFIGYLGNVDMVDAVLDFVKYFPSAKIVVDPIMGDHGNYYNCMGQEHVNAFRRLIPHADIILPNLTEACLLTNIPYPDIGEQIDINILFARLKEMGARQVVITSIPGQLGDKNIALCLENQVEILSIPKINCEFHGTGDVFDAVIIGSYLREMNLKECVIKAHEFVSECITNSTLYDYDTREGLMVEKSLSSLV